MSTKKIEKLLSEIKTKPKKKIVAQFVEFGPDAILPLLKILMGPELAGEEHVRDQAKRDTAAAALVKLGKHSAVPFVIGLQSCHGTVRAGCAYILGRLPHIDTEEFLLEALEIEVCGQTDGIAFDWISWALVQNEVDAKLVMPWMLRALQSPHALVRASAAGALGDLGDENAIEPLLHAFTDPEAEVRHHAVEALGKFYDDRIVLPLIQTLDDEDLHVRSGAASALKFYEDPRCSTPLIALLHDVEEEVRWAAIDALGYFDDPPVLDALIACLDDANPILRKAACRSLRRLDHPIALEPMKLLLSKETHPAVIASAQKAIQKLKKHFESRQSVS